MTWLATDSGPTLSLLRERFTSVIKTEKQTTEMTPIQRDMVFKYIEVS
jgi:hypothetical protein